MYIPQHANKRRRISGALYGDSQVKTWTPFQPCAVVEATTTDFRHNHESQVEPNKTAVRPCRGELVPGEDEIVCFGMVQGIGGRCERPKSIGDFFLAQLDSSDRFSAKDSPRVSGVILSEHGQMLQALLEEETLILHVSCSTETESTSKRAAPTYAQIPCSLEITIYGPFELFELFGSFFQEYENYLQDPRTCHLNVRYCNPHRLSSEEHNAYPLVSEVVSPPTGLIHLQDVVERPDLLDILSGQEELEEAQQPLLILSALHRHQKQALTFMLRREQGWSFDGKHPDIWEASETTQSRYFINRISEVHQVEAPPQFRGGIIADPMGLGKTLTMITLVATDLESSHSADERFDPGNDNKCQVQTTLIVVPQPLIGSWEDQISEHVRDGGLRFCRHHGKTKLTALSDIDAVNVVLTTYHTLSADWKSCKASENHIMFSVRWRRVILDEAHIIRNMKSRMARAIYELDSISRWVVTGTPIQNHLSDLAALLKFIRPYPYDDPKRFDADISRFWKSGKDKEAVKRLERLSSCLILRRAKRTIDLPPRRDTKCPIDFNKQERTLYDTIRRQTIIRIDDALLHESEFSTSGVYVNFLQQIESMRLVCNLGLHYHTRHDKLTPHDAMEWSKVAQETFNIQREMDSISCSQCSSILDLSETFFDDPTIQDSPQFSRCLKYTCSECSYRLRLAGHTMVCGHNPRCSVAPVSISYSAFEETPSLLSQQKKPTSIGLPSKVEALISDLKALPSDVKCIVFSTWRLTLDLVETGLIQSNFRCVRFDGKVPQTQRQHVLRQFKFDPSIRIMLLTLSCGAVGLTLVEASRAYLMEPHWNPTMEEQALARIHRIGQTREVITVKFYVRDSFEERVMEVQESKKNLAAILLSGHDGGHADDSLGALQLLRSLL